MLKNRFAKLALATAAIVGFALPSAQAATAAGLGLNAGHDLNLDNLPALVQAIPHLKEVSIGHAFMADALEMGYAATVAAYLRALEPRA